MDRRRVGWLGSPQAHNLRPCLIVCGDSRSRRLVARDNPSRGITDAGVAELADAVALEVTIRQDLRVRVPSPALKA